VKTWISSRCRIEEDRRLDVTATRAENG